MSDKYQQPIEAATDEINAMDMMIEFGIYHSLTASVCQALTQIPSDDLYQLMRCTLKSMVVFYAQTVIFEDDKSKLVDALSLLQKVFGGGSQNKAFNRLKRGMEYQIVIHHLESCGPESARVIINQYFPSHRSNKKADPFRKILLGFCDNV